MMDELLKRLEKLNNRVEFLSENREGATANLFINDTGFKWYRLANAFADVSTAQAEYIKQLESRVANKWMVSKTLNDCRAKIAAASNRNAT